jgi:hypothetical protein
VDYSLSQRPEVNEHVMQAPLRLEQCPVLSVVEWMLKGCQLSGCFSPSSSRGSVVLGWPHADRNLHRNVDFFRDVELDRESLPPTVGARHATGLCCIASRELVATV